MNRRNVDYVYAHNERKHYPLVDDKIVCKERLATRGVPVLETLDVCEGLFDVGRCVQAATQHQDFVVKPANGSGGKGILLLGTRNADSNGVTWEGADGKRHTAEDLRDHLADTVFGAFGRQLADRALVERRLSPHEVFAELWQAGVCDLRIIVLEGRPILAMLRVPTARSRGKANLHQGGIGVGIDISTGRTHRASLRGRSITHHPETGLHLIDRQLPSWGRVLEVAHAAASAVPLQYLGVDIVLDVAGTPLVLEMNARPGLEIQNVNGVSLADAVAAGVGR
jgi:alpha-L-glutamate ligase-like protein